MKLLQLAAHLLLTLALAIFLMVPLILLVTIYYWFNPEPAIQSVNDDVWFDCEAV